VDSIYNILKENELLDLLKMANLIIQDETSMSSDLCSHLMFNYGFLSNFFPKIFKLGFLIIGFIEHVIQKQVKNSFLVA